MVLRYNFTYFTQCKLATVKRCTAYYSRQASKSTLSSEDFIWAPACAGGSLLAATVIGAAVLMNGKQSEQHSYPGVLALLADVAGHPKEVISAQIRMVMSTVLQQ